MSTNIIENVCKICGGQITYLHDFAHLSPYAYLLVVFIIIMLFVLIRKNGKYLILETLLGKMKIGLNKNKNGKNTVNMCELCRMNVATYVTSIIQLCQRIHRTELQNINEQLRELDNQFILESSWVNNCHAQMINNKIREERTNIEESERTKIFMKNNQILNYIWLIKRQEIYEFLKAIILANHFVDKNASELRVFIQEKCKILSASLEGGVNLFPDWDDSELLFTRYEYLNIMMEKIRPRITESMQTLLEKCQIIQQKYNRELKTAENEKIKIIEDFKESLPPKQKEEKED